MSDEGGVMSFEVIGEITLVSGNTRTRQRGSGHSVVPSTQSVSRLRAGYLRFGLGARVAANRVAAGCK
jgi:hypothetical protein